jgi:hypothetical protein
MIFGSDGKKASRLQNAWECIASNIAVAYTVKKKGSTNKIVPRFYETPVPLTAGLNLIRHKYRRTSKRKANISIAVKQRGI